MKKIASPLLAFMVLGSSCQQDATMAQRKEFVQKKFNTTEVVEIGGQVYGILVRDQSNQVWHVFVDGKLRVESAVIIFPADGGKQPYYPQTYAPVEPNFDVK